MNLYPPGDNPGPRRILSANGTALTILTTCKYCPGGLTDLSVIQCNASNPNGYVFSSAYLNVLRK